MQSAMEKKNLWIPQGKGRQVPSSVFDCEPKRCAKARRENSFRRSTYVNFETKLPSVLHPREAGESQCKLEKLRFFLQSSREPSRISLVGMYEQKRNDSHQASEDYSNFIKLSRTKKYQELTARTSELAIKEQELEQAFTDLVKQWKNETRGISSTNELSMHPAYQKIIGMGERALPLLLKELEKKTGQWFWALKAISREDPVPQEHRGQTKQMIKFWLEWGQAKGYKW